MVKSNAFALLAALPLSLGSSLNVINNCLFEVYCGGAKNDGTWCPTVLVPGKGGKWKSPLLANDDNIGSVLKCSKSPDLRKPFQMELALQHGHSWFDLSALDGDPFFDVARHAEIAGQCVLDCPAHSTGCEWPIQPDCQTSEDAWLTLC